MKFKMLNINVFFWVYYYFMEVQSTSPLAEYFWNAIC